MSDSVELPMEIISEITYCAACNLPLIPPIRTVQDLGDICSLCYSANTEHYHYYNVVENKALNTLIKGIRFPCYFVWRGCPEKLNATEYRSHLNEKCIYRSFPCFFHDCVSTIDQNTVKHHLYYKHKEHFVSDNNYEFIVPVNISKEERVVKVLDLHSRFFVLYLTIVKTTNKILHSIYDIENTCKQYIFNVEFTQDTCILRSAKVYITQDLLIKIQDHANDDFTLLTKPTGNSQLIVKVTATEIMPHNNEEIQKLYECPVCLSLMKGPIWQCNNGHSICNDCRQNLSNCPICRCYLGETRNLLAENVLQLVKNPCAYKQNGCKMKVRISDNHETTCFFRYYTCPFKCSYQLTSQALIEHVESEHSDWTYKTDSHIFSVPIESASLQTWAFVAFGQIFKVNLKQDENNISFTVEEILGIFGKKNNFLYEYTMLDPIKNIRKLSFTETCSDYTENSIDMNHNCIILPKRDVLKSYSCNNIFKFQLKLIKDFTNALSNVKSSPKNEKIHMLKTRYFVSTMYKRSDRNN